MHTQAKNQHITIAGAGLVGSLLAVMLAKQGYSITLYESRPDMREQNIAAGRSINLALANRGILPLLQAGVMERVKPDLITMRGRMIHDEQGESQLQAYGQRPHEVIYSVSRGDLNKLLMTAAEETGRVNIHFSQEIETVDFDSNRLNLLDRETGQRSQADFSFIVGADGANSPVREAIVQANASHTDIQNSREPLGHSYKELCIPAGEKGEFQIEKQALHIWPRGQFMLIALPNPDASFTVTLFLPNQGENSFEQLQTKEQVNHFFRTYFNDALQLIPNLADEFFENPTGNLATIRCQPWSFADKALILGDAAHAIVPFHGQGMNCGFEDCGELLKLLDKNGHNWAEVISQFEQQRKPNADAIADMAIENYLEMRDSVRDPHFLLKKELGFELEQRWPTHFIPRYSMVMFNLLPYSEAKNRGKIQLQILETLLAGKSSIEQVDMEQAEQLILQQLPQVPASKALI